jgi:hypothetical protein
MEELWTRGVLVDTIGLEFCGAHVVWILAARFRWFASASNRYVKSAEKESTYKILLFVALGFLLHSLRYRLRGSEEM